MSLVVGGLVAALVACVPAGGPEPKTDEEKTLYVLGMQVADLSKNFRLSEEELPYVRKGFSDRTLGKEPLATIADYSESVDALLDDRTTELAKVEIARSDAWMKGFGLEPNTFAGDGFFLTTFVEGTGEQVKAKDTVYVRYTSKIRTGETVDQSSVGGAPDGTNTVTLGKVIPCLNRGMLKTREGGKYRLVCASWLAHGNRGLPPLIPGGAAIQYDLDVLKIETLFREHEEDAS